MTARTNGSVAIVAVVLALTVGVVLLLFHMSGIHSL